MRLIISILFCLLITCANAQFNKFFRGFGIFGALTESCHYYRNLDASKKDPLIYNPTYYYPQNHISAEHFSWAAGIFAEFFRHDHIRWQTELEYANKGASEMPIINPYLGTRSGSFTNNTYTYIQWNNYLKFFGPFGLPNNIYLMPGIKLEYLFQQSTPVFAPYSSNFAKFWASGDVGIGYEFPLFKRISGFVEYHWNNDVLPHSPLNDVKIRNRTFEYRFGLIYRPRKRYIDDCNAPRYNGPAY